MAVVAKANRTKWALVVVMAVVACVWLGQGLGLIGGSFMTGEPIWGIIGALLVAGAAVWAAKRN